VRHGNDRRTQSTIDRRRVIARGKHTLPHTAKMERWFVPD
jgi:hypothetical protein